ncbi:hypothetical protein AT05_08605 [Schleiferia thermophila str. Yellowstone]|jgi:thioredoxin-related protein|uniref:hypothetical protein n=2 Tax=Schleiferia thermophila TaxID=884107 RepID=UPI0004E6E017|nr:hypothetical protein [Schleiferia thermophila]KFD38691.1 hypothetical protein AT05_08605 [Schleiferia thermophila str. Yellowstone]
MKTIQSAFILILFGIKTIGCSSENRDFLDISPQSKITDKNYNLIVINPKQCFSCIRKNEELIEQARKDTSQEYVILLPTNFSSVNPAYKGFTLVYYELNRSTFPFDESFIANKYKPKGNNLIVYKN